MGLFSRNHYQASGSLGKLAWRRLLRNKLAIISILYITLWCAIAILGYLITPDKTPFANGQNLVLTTKKPGFRVTELIVRKNETITRHSFIHTMLFGQKSCYITIPVTGYLFTDSTIIIKEYEGPGVTSSQSVYNMADVVYDLSGKPMYNQITKTFSFETLSGENFVVKASLLKDEIIRKHLKTKTFILGTDRFGRDVLSQLLIGARVSLAVGCISVFISLLIGIFMGAVAGYFGGKTDSFIMWVINVIWSVPTLLLVIVITFTLGKGFWQVFIAVGLTMWVEVARVVRGQFMSLREKEFVEAGKALGYSDFRIIFRHILPNVLAPVIVISAANFASAILLESGLSFLGIGVQPPMPSWGTMIRENYPYIILDYAYLAILPGAAIMLLVLAFMVLGNSLRDALDVRTTG